MKEKTIIFGSLSKTYAMTGWRIGYLAAPKDFISAVVKVQQNAILSVCAFAQAGAVAALQGPQDGVDAMVAEFDKRRRIILDGIERIPGLASPAIPTGAFYVFARHQVEGMDSERLSAYLLEQAGVATVPGAPFGSRGKDYLRISYTVSQDDCREGIDRLYRVAKRDFR